jgi:hypothetical protein
MSAGQSTIMTLQRLRAMLDAYGAAPDHWPAAERSAAEALIAGSAEAARAVAEARALDMALDESTAQVPADALARLTPATAFPPPRAAEQRAAVKIAPSPKRGWATALADAFWPRAAVFASIAALGIVVGLASEPAYSISDDSVFAASDDGIYAVSGLSAETIEDLLP